jgi:hypothetical protein
VTACCGGGPVVYALGLLHVLAADPWTGGAGGSRAAEAQKSGRREQVPSACLGLLRRALDAPVEPATLRALREGALPPQGTRA